MSVVRVGNDVVDLESERSSGKAADRRFVERVFDEEGRRAVDAAPDPDLELWCRWAAKEAGFKVVSKLLAAPPPFVHRAFRVRWDVSEVIGNEDEEAVVRRGSVRYETYAPIVTVTLAPGRVHAVARAPEAGTGPTPGRVVPGVGSLDGPEVPWRASLDELRGRFTERELDSVRTRESAAVRLAARAELAALLGVEERRLEIVCEPGPTTQRPPYVLLDGSPAGADVSLSHDGRWVAWVVWVSPKRREAA